MYPYYKAKSITSYVLFHAERQVKETEGAEKGNYTRVWQES